MRGLLGVAASVLAGIAAAVASQVGDADLAPFFVLLTVGGGLVAWAAYPPFIGARRRIAQGIALAWLVLAGWVIVLLLAFRGASGPTPEPEARLLEVPVSIYYVLGLYGGAALVAILAFGRERWFERSAVDGSEEGR